MSRRSDDRPAENRPQRLSPQQVRAVTFTAASRRRGGLDPDQVHAFLYQVADEMIRLHRELAAATDDAIRVKTAMQQWQVEHAATCTQLQPDQRAAPRPPAQQPWTGNATPHPADPWRPHPGYPTDPR
jgi:DivIVA domain-containing protein